MGPIDNPEFSRVHYLTGECDSVYWDHWDLDYDTNVFDISDYEDTIFGYDVIYGVGLLQLGLYSIHAQIDVQTYTNITYLMKSNYDEGQATFGATNNIGEPGEPFWEDNYLFRLDHWRQVVEVPPPDHLWGGEATDVQIVFCFSGETSMPGVTPGVWDGANPDPAGQLWIPGGYDGAWGYVPNMMVHYWGPMDGDPAWPDSVFDPPAS
jgi:hypothetical protein